MYKELIKRDFDNIEETTETGDYFKKYPMPWSECSYGFFSNSSGSPDWSQYAFIQKTNTMSWCQSNIYDRTSMRTGKVTENKTITSLGRYGRMYYIDASETPGIISNLDISAACCPGTQIYKIGRAHV